MLMCTMLVVSPEKQQKDVVIHVAQILRAIRIPTNIPSSNNVIIIDGCN